MRDNHLEKDVFFASGIGMFIAAGWTFLVGFEAAFTLWGSPSDQDSSFFRMALLISLALILTGVGSLRFATSTKPFAGLVSGALAVFLYTLQGPWAWGYASRGYYLGGVVSSNPWNIRADDNIALTAIPGAVLVLALLGGIALRHLKSKGRSITFPKVRPTRDVIQRRWPLVLGAGVAILAGVAATLIPSSTPTEQKMAAHLGTADLFANTATFDAEGSSVTYLLAPVETPAGGLQVEDTAPVLEAIYNAAGMDLDLIHQKVKGGKVTKEDVQTSYRSYTPPSVTLAFKDAHLPAKVENTTWFTQKETTYQAVLPITASKLAETETTSKVYHLSSPRHTSGPLGTLHLPSTNTKDIIVRWTQQGWEAVPTTIKGSTATSEVTKPGIYTVITPDPGSAVLKPSISNVEGDVQPILIPGTSLLAYEGTFNPNSTIVHFTGSITDSTGRTHVFEEATDNSRQDILLPVPQDLAEGPGSLTLKVVDALGSQGEKTWPTTIQKSNPSIVQDVTVIQDGPRLLVSWKGGAQPSGWSIGVELARSTGGVSGASFGCKDLVPGDRREASINIGGRGDGEGTLASAVVTVSAVYAGSVDARHLPIRDSATSTIEVTNTDEVADATC